MPLTMTGTFPLSTELAADDSIASSEEGIECEMRCLRRERRVSELKLEKLVNRLTLSFPLLVDSTTTTVSYPSRSRITEN